MELGVCAKVVVEQNNVLAERRILLVQRNATKIVLNVQIKNWIVKVSPYFVIVSLIHFPYYVFLIIKYCFFLEHVTASI